MKTIARLSISAALLATPFAASAQTHELVDCEGQWQASIQNIWITDNGGGIRTFYNGAIRVIRIDTEEPAAASAGLVILMPEAQGWEGIPGTVCRVLWGFGSVDVDHIRSSYDPERGLTLTVPTSMMDSSGIGQNPRDIRILINAARATAELLD